MPRVIKTTRGMIVYIYGLYDPRDNALRYIGKTVNPSRRLALHRCEKRGTHKNNWLDVLRAISLRPVLRVLETIENSNDLDWQERERWWIQTSQAAGHPLTNLDSGGRGGKQLSPQTRARISASNIGKKMSTEAVEKMKQTKRANLTPEVRARLSAARVGKKQSPATIEARRRGMMGHAVPMETRRRIAAAQIGKFVSDDTRSKIRAARALQVITPEARAKQSATLKGRQPSPQTIAASVARCKGVPFTEEHKTRLRAAKRAWRQAGVFLHLKRETAADVVTANRIARLVA